MLSYRFLSHAKTCIFLLPHHHSCFWNSLDLNCLKTTHCVTKPLLNGGVGCAESTLLYRLLFLRGTMLFLLHPWRRVFWQTGLWPVSDCLSNDRSYGCCSCCSCLLLSRSRENWRASAVHCVQIAMHIIPACAQISEILLSGNFPGNLRLWRNRRPAGLRVVRQHVDWQRADGR